MSTGYDVISFLSDLGTSDESVGVVHAVLADMAPGVRVVDLAHDLLPFDLRGASLALARAIPYVPAGIVLGVVDPFPCDAIAVEVAGGQGVLVGPDNGLLAPAVALAGGAERAVRLVRDEFHLAAPGRTFRARDVFAPVCAHLCSGVDLEQLGEPVDPALLMPSVVALPREEGGELLAEVTHVDRFGNAQLNVAPDDLDDTWGPAWGHHVRMRFGDQVRVAVVAERFGDLATGAPGLVVDSSGMLAVAVNRFSAAAELGLAVGDQVNLAPAEAPSGTDTPVALGPKR